MTEMIERLAEKWDEYNKTAERKDFQEELVDEARWWVLAVAEELEQQPNTNPVQTAARFLRAQAKEGEES